MQMLPSRKPPIGSSGMVLWLRRNLFGSFGNSIVSIITAALIGWLLFGLLSWVLSEAVWQQVWNNLQLFAVYRYPDDLLWRPLSVAIMLMLLLGMTAGAASSSPTALAKGSSLSLVGFAFFSALALAVSRAPSRWLWLIVGAALAALLFFVSRRWTVGRDSGEGQIIRGVFWWIFSLVLLLSVLGVFFWESVRLLWVLAVLAGLAGNALGTFAPRVVRFLPWLWGASLFVAFFLLYGFLRTGPFNIVPTNLWGGFMLTLILSAVGITISFPLGVALALGRRSKLPAIKYFCITFIEIIRGAPLIAWLFIASLMVPLLLNIDTEAISGLNKALVAVTLFSAAYMAENVRGGLQSIPKGQPEAARALGLSGWQSTRLIVLPQALRAVIPAIVGQSIGLFKDTSLVFIVGLADFFQVSNIVASQPSSLQVPGGIRLELCLFLAVIYWFFAFRMSIASRQLEKQMGVGER